MSSVAAVAAAAGTAVAGPIGGIVGTVAGGFIHTGDEAGNADAAAAALPLALAGNLTAVKAIYKRGTYIQVAAEAAPFKAALSQIQAVHPEYLKVPGATDGPGLPGVPEEWITGVSPQQVVPRIQQYTVMARPSANGQLTVTAANQPTTDTAGVGAALGSLTGGGNTTLLVISIVAFVVYKLVTGLKK